MQGKSFASYGVDECWIDECRSRDISRAERCNPSLPKVLEDLTGRFHGLKIIWACRATWREVGSIVFGGFRGSNTRQDHLL